MIKFVEVKEVPICQKKNLQNYLEEFMNMNIKVARVEFDELDYKNIDAAAAAFNNSAKRGGFPITVTRRNGELYLINRDI